MGTFILNMFRGLGDFVKPQIDKILLVFLILLFLAVFIHVLHAKDADAAALQWIEKSVDMVTGSLLTLITGRIFNPEKKNGNGNTNPDPHPQPDVKPVVQLDQPAPVPAPNP